MPRRSRKATPSVPLGALVVPDAHVAPGVGRARVALVRAGREARHTVRAAIRRRDRRAEPLEIDVRVLPVEKVAGGTVDHEDVPAGRTPAGPADDVRPAVAGEVCGGHGAPELLAVEIAVHLIELRPGRTVEDADVAGGRIRA